MLVPGPPVGPRADGQQRVTQFFKRKDPEVTAAAPAPTTEAQQRAARRTVRSTGAAAAATTAPAMTAPAATSSVGVGDVHSARVTCAALLSRTPNPCSPMMM